jgi:hypothetical protein
VEHVAKRIAVGGAFAHWPHPDRPTNAGEHLGDRDRTRLRLRRLVSGLAVVMTDRREAPTNCCRLRAGVRFGCEEGGDNAGISWQHLETARAAPRAEQPPVRGIDPLGRRCS